MYSIFCSEQSGTCASGSAVEHLLAKEGVAGSIPVSRFFDVHIQGAGVAPLHAGNCRKVQVPRRLRRGCFIARIMR